MNKRYHDKPVICMGISMKSKMVSKCVKMCYLICCLLIALTPNVLAVSGRSNNTTTTILENASDLEVEPFREELVALAHKAVTEHKGLTSLIVMKDGKVYLESYYNGNDESSIFEIHSCTKTVIALLTGIAIDNNFINDEESPFIDMFHGLNVKMTDDRFQDIKIKDMLSMSSGINWDKYSSSLKNRMEIITNGYDYGLALISGAEMKDIPGNTFCYDSNESRSLMAMVAYNAGVSDVEFVEEYLFHKLEISDYLWPYNDSGLLPGGKDLFVSARDMAKIGQMLLDKGSYKGEQIVSEKWVEKIFQIRQYDVLAEDIEPADSLDYCFYIWHTRYKERDVFFAYGRGGQYIFMIPEQNILVVTSAIDKVRTDNFREIAFEVMDIFMNEVFYE